MLRKYFQLVDNKKQAQTSKWDGSGILSIELGLDENSGQIVDVTHDRALPPATLSEVSSQVQQYHLNLAQNPAEIEMAFEAHGSETPASMYGGADNLGWPAESDDERTVKSVTLYLNGQQSPVGLSDRTKTELVNAYTAEIDAEELNNVDDRDGPEYDPDEPRGNYFR